jgi:hypothetical protein
MAWVGTVTLTDAEGEAVLDALSFWAAGFRNVTAAYGVEGEREHAA